MARCWSCGTEIPGGLHPRYWFRCPTCVQVEEVIKIRERLESSGATSFYGAIESVGFEITEELSEIASILEWGLEEIEWKLDQIRGILGSIDKTLKTPSATQSNEWRQIAEELRERRVLDESEKFFLKSLEINPLDYRTYIGLGKTYLQMDAPDKARTFWQKSLPYSPKEEIDYKSYSYRLIGRTYFCEENYQKAASMLKTSIELSPNYYLGHYDYAQYCALIGDKENCLASLRIAVVREPIPLGLVAKERNFESPKEEVKNLLEKIKSSKDLQTEIKVRLIWKKAGLESQHIDKVVETVKRIESENKVNLNSLRFEIENSPDTFCGWKYRHLEKQVLSVGKKRQKIQDPLEKVIKEELNLETILDIPRLIREEIDRWVRELLNKIIEDEEKAIKVLEAEIFSKESEEVESKTFPSIRKKISQRASKFSAKMRGDTNKMYEILIDELKVE